MGSTTDQARLEIQTTLERRLARGELELPMLPSIATRVIDMCNRIEVDASRLAAAIHEDAALAGHVLRLSNSALYSPGTPIVTLQQAVSWLGILRLREVVLTATVRARLFTDRRHAAELERVWRHSLLTAGLAREVARLRKRHVESAFLWGLLHDIGRPTVMATLEDLEGLGLPPLAGSCFAEVLDELHGPFGAALATQWQLPHEIAEAALYHHLPHEAGANAEPAWLVHFADFLAHRLAEHGDAAFELDEVRDHQALDTLDLYPETLASLRESAAEVLGVVRAMEV